MIRAIVAWKAKMLKLDCATTNHDATNAFMALDHDMVIEHFANTVRTDDLPLFAQRVQEASMCIRVHGEEKTLELRPRCGLFMGDGYVPPCFVEIYSEAVDKWRDEIEEKGRKTRLSQHWTRSITEKNHFESN